MAIMRFIKILSIGILALLLFWLILCFLWIESESFDGIPEKAKIHLPVLVEARNQVVERSI